MLFVCTLFIQTSNAIQFMIALVNIREMAPLADNWVTNTGSVHLASNTSVSSRVTVNKLIAAIPANIGKTRLTVDEKVAMA